MLIDIYKNSFINFTHSDIFKEIANISNSSNIHYKYFYLVISLTNRGGEIIKSYNYHKHNWNWYERLIEGPYVSPGGIIEYMVQSVYRMCKTKAA